MIEYIKGDLTELTPAIAVIEAGGVGYGLSISLNTYSAIQGKQQIKLYVYEVIREDAHLLFGFATKTERELFVALITVSGVGGNTARMILSAFTPAELSDIIASGNDKLLKSVKGIGLKMAQRIIIDLKDKIQLQAIGTESNVSRNAISQAVNTTMEEATAALTMLGFAPAPTQKVVSTILKEHPEYPVEQIIKLALKQL